MDRENALKALDRISNALREKIYYGRIPAVVAAITSDFATVRTALTEAPQGAKVDVEELKDQAWFEINANENWFDATRAEMERIIDFITADYDLVKKEK